MMRGWHVLWANSLVALLVQSYTECTALNMHALRGGAMCECEIAFIRKLMPALGFATVSDGEEVRGYTRYEWKIVRPKSMPFYVLLWVHSDADKINHI